MTLEEKINSIIYDWSAGLNFGPGAPYLIEYWNGRDPNYFLGQLGGLHQQTIRSLLRRHHAEALLSPIAAVRQLAYSIDKDKE